VTIFRSHIAGSRIIAGKMRHQPRILLSSVRGAVLCAIALSPCFAGKVQVVVGPGVDFSQYKTYQWLPTKTLTKTGVVEDEPTTTPIVKEAVNRELSARSLQEVASGGDLQVTTVILTESNPQLESAAFPGTHAYDYGIPTDIAMGRYNRQGTLVINLIDAKTKKTAWAGMAAKTIDNKAGGGLKKIPQATADIFKKFPAHK